MTGLELVAQLGKKGIDILVTIVQLGQLLRDARHALGKLPSVLGNPFDTLRKADVAISFQCLHARDKLGARVVQLMNQSLDAASIVLQRQETSLQRLKFISQVLERLLRLLDLVISGLGDLRELRQISDTNLKRISLLVGFDAG